MIRVSILIAVTFLQVGCGGGGFSESAPTEDQQNAAESGAETETETIDAGGADTHPADSAATNPGSSETGGNGIDDAGTDSGLPDTVGTDIDTSDSGSTDIASRPYGGEWTPSPYDHLDSEVSSSAPIVRTSTSRDENQPLRYPGVFEREREAFGYNPRFLPGRPYFDKFNLPWIYVSDYNQLGGTDPLNPEHVLATTREPTGRQLSAITFNQEEYYDRYSQSNPCTTCDGHIQRLTKEGKWVTLSVKMLAAKFGFNTAQAGASNGKFRYLEQIYFQDNGDVFLKAEHGVLRYRNSTDTWYGYASTFAPTWLMVGNGEGPPILVRDDFDNKVFYVRALIDGGSGDLQFVQTTIDHGLPLNILKEGNPVARIGNTLHIAAWSADESVRDRQDHNSAMYYLRYNMDNSSLDSLFMGWSGSPSQKTPDNHNFPVIYSDSKNYLHYISGSHNHQLWHRRSLVSAVDKTWANDGNLWDVSTTANEKFSPGPEKPMMQFSADSTPQDGVDYVGDTDAEYTYVHYSVDRDDNVHIVTRDNSEDGEGQRPGSFNRLAYIRGISNNNGDYSWETRGSLLTPNWNLYSNYWHRVNSDRKGNLYASYLYTIQNISRDRWFNQKTRWHFEDISSCSSATNQSDCINVKDEHEGRWPEEELKPRSLGLDQVYARDPVILGSVDGGLTWKIVTTDDFMAEKQDPSIANVVGR